MTVQALIAHQCWKEAGGGNHVAVVLMDSIWQILKISLPDKVDSIDYIEQWFLN